MFLYRLATGNRDGPLNDGEEEKVYATIII
jgi:hypothetical protein